jgi:hypothetical protein
MVSPEWLYLAEHSGKPQAGLSLPKDCDDVKIRKRTGNQKLIPIKGLY